MAMWDLARVVGHEKETVVYLQRRGILKEFEHCPYCGGGRVGGVRRNKVKCYGCRREWSVKRGSVLENIKIPLGKVLLAVKLFEMELPALRASRQLGVAYKTMLKLYDVLRRCIYCELEGKSDCLRGEVEMDESYFGGTRKGKRGRGAANKIPVFGILERQGKVRVEIVEDVTAQTLLKLALKKVKRGSLIYTDRYRSYDGLVALGFRHERIDHSLRFANGRVYINGIEGFWSYAKERLAKYHGVSKEKFVLYLKELEYRYNMRSSEIFQNLLELLAKHGRVAQNA